MPSLVWQTVRPLRWVMRAIGAVLFRLGHDLDALLKGEAVVFVLAVRGLEDELALTGNVPELPEGGDDERLRSG